MGTFSYLLSASALMLLAAALGGGLPAGQPGSERDSLPGDGKHVAVRVGIGVALVAALALGGIFFAAAVGACAVAYPAAASRLRSRRDARRRDEQLPEAVAAIASGLRAGRSLSQALAYAAGECSSPTSDDLLQVVEYEAMGMSIGDSLTTWVDAGGGQDLRLVASVLDHHRRSGGDLPAVLDRVADTLRERRTAARETRSLTAQARLSGIILGILPIGFFAFLSLLSPSDMAAALRAPAGMTAVGVGLVMQALAFLWIRQILRVES